MPDSIPAKDRIVDRHPVSEKAEITLDFPSTLLRVVSLSNHGSSPRDDKTEASAAPLIAKQSRHLSLFQFSVKPSLSADQHHHRRYQQKIGQQGYQNRNSCKKSETDQMVQRGQH